MAKKKRQIGILHLYVSDPLETGLMPDIGDMTELGKIVVDSVDLAKEDDTITDIKNQETGDVDISILSDVGADKITFNTRDLNITNIIRSLGGSEVNGKWYEDASYFRGRDLAVKIISRSVEGLHWVVDYPKAKLTAKMISALTETETGSIMHTLTKLTPIDESTGIKQSPKQKYAQPQAPASGTVDNTTDEFLFELVPSFDTATEYEYSQDGGTSWNDVTANPITGLTGAISIGDLLVRVKAVTTGSDQYVSGFALANTEAFTV